MARFRYRMQNILNLKMKLEEQARMKYAEQRHALTLAEQQRDALIAEKERYEEESRSSVGETVTIADLKLNAERITTMKYLIADQQKVVEKENKKLDEVRAKLEEVMMERKAQEKLREKAFEQFKKDELAAESKAIDELTSYVYGNKNPDE
ncbi:MAG: flagellar export protein FliJ [Lachnospiraceae bacterium]|nr:flagellar export protein FliJ [Lachnospiraceae bacterium]